MSPEEAFLKRMEDIAPANADQMFLYKGPQQPVLPVAVVLLIDDPKPSHLRGGSKHGRARIQLDVYAGESSGADTATLALNFYSALHGDEGGSGLVGFRGHVGGTPDGLFLEQIKYEDRRVLYEPNEMRLVGIQADFFVYYRAH